MEQNDQITQMLELMSCPAFCVQDGIIIKISQEAERCMITEGTPIRDLLVTGQKEYAQYQGGSLHLMLRICGSIRGACVNRIGDVDVFLPEQESDSNTLQAFALAAQELRAPLSNIMAVTDRLFPLSCSDDDPEAAAMAARINRGLFQMLRLIGNMSDAYQYVQENEARMEMRDLSAIWDEFFKKTAHLLQGTGTELHFTGLRESVYGLADAEKLERAASNMISNALTYAPKGSAIEAKLTRQGSMLYLTIRDSGNGVAPELRSSMFNSYQRQPGIEDGRHGIGLGMVLIRGAAAMHGGTVLMEQSPELGTRITMTMSIRQDHGGIVRSPIIHVDYAGERDHMLIELAESLPPELYKTDKVN